MKLKRIRQSFVFFLIVLILFTVSFIFYQSCLPPAESAEKSNRVKGFFATLFGDEKTLFGAFFLKYVRKIAHFVEFFILGSECAVLALLRKKRGYSLLALLFGFGIASLDEAIQNFTGRGPSFWDVCLDFFGFCTASLLVKVLALLILRAQRNKKIRKEKENV